MSKKRDICLAFGRTVRKLRESLEVSQEDLADRVEIHRTYMGGIERGERNPTLVTIKKIANALGVSPKKLMDGL